LEKLSVEEKYEKILLLADNLKSNLRTLSDYLSIDTFNNIIDQLNRFTEVSIKQQEELVSSYKSSTYDRSTDIIDEVKKNIEEYGKLGKEITGLQFSSNISELFKIMDVTKKFFRLTYIIYNELAEVRDLIKDLDKIIQILEKIYTKVFYVSGEAIDKVRKEVISTKKTIIRSMILTKKLLEKGEKTN
jgi:hypothetical protein